MHVFFLFVYKVVLDWVSYAVIGPVFPPYTLTIDINWMKILESYLLLFVVAKAIPKERKEPSAYFLVLFFLLSYVPLASVYGMANQPRLPFYASTGFWVGVALLTRAPLRITVPRVREGLTLAALLMAGLLAYGVFAVVRLGPSFQLNFSQVYEVRSAFVAQRLPLSMYLLPWLAFVVCPLLLALFAIRRKYVVVALVALLQLQLYTTTGNKIYLFGTVLVLLLLWVVTKGKDILTAISSWLSLIAVCWYLSYTWFRDIWLSGILVNRLLVLPGVISFDYFDFFGANGHLYFSHSFLRSILEYPYQVTPYKLIGYVYFGNPDNTANTGIVADAFMNFGYTGLIITGLGIVLVLKLVDALCLARDRRLVIAAVTLPMMNLTNVGFYTTLLTNGLGFALLLCLLLPSDSVVGNPTPQIVMAREGRLQ